MGSKVIALALLNKLIIHLLTTSFSDGRLDGRSVGIELMNSTMLRRCWPAALYSSTRALCAGIDRALCTCTCAPASGRPPHYSHCQTGFQVLAALALAPQAIADGEVTQADSVEASDLDTGFVSEYSNTGCERVKVKVKYLISQNFPPSFPLRYFSA